MRVIDWFAPGVCYDTFSSMAFAREGHEQAAPTVADGSTCISLTSDPLRDTPAVLKAYTLKQGVDEPHWFFLTGDKAQMDLVLARIGQIVPPPEQHSTRSIVGDAANECWSKIHPDVLAAAFAQRLQWLTIPVAGR
ncbi:SCO family protein [Pseudomonas sp. IT-196MI5]|uniref:SCO family protein n=1 Tax=unclassified Pseudomonas TaxID=196821 RepID=UPI0039DF783C